MALRTPALIATAALFSLAACRESPLTPANTEADAASRSLLGGNVVFDQGTLLIRGGDASNEIHVAYTTDGVQVVMDGQRELILAPVRALHVDAGSGDNLIRYQQLVIADMAVTLIAGDGDDRVEVLIHPRALRAARSGAPMRLATSIDTGSGSDQVDFRWNSTDLPALNAYAELTVNGTAFRPDVADEVLVAFSHGDPRVPLSLDLDWNRWGAGSDQGPDADARSLDLTLGFGPASADVAMQLTGGAGLDEVAVSAHYSGVRFQQGRVVLDADLNEGDNRFDGRYIVSSVTHAHISNTLTAGDGDNSISLRADRADPGDRGDGAGRRGVQDGTSTTVLVSETRLGNGNNNVLLEDDLLGGRDDHTYRIDVGDGDNATVVRFGDGLRGARPPATGRSVTGSYRTGGGTNRIDIQGDVTGPVATEFGLELGHGHNSVITRYTLNHAWPDRVPPGQHLVPSQTRVVVTGAGADELDMKIQVPTREAWSSKPKEIVVVGSRVRAATLDFVQRPGGGAEPANHDPEYIYVPVRRTFAVQGLRIEGDVAMDVQFGDDRGPFTYLQDQVHLEPGAGMNVQLRGGASGDAMLALLRDISGPGSFHFVADGAAGNDFIATLARGLNPGRGGERSFEVRGGSGDDVLALAVDGEARDGPVAGRIDGGPGSDTCFATTGVLVENCARATAISELPLRRLRGLFGVESVGAWLPKGLTLPSWNSKERLPT
jgi:hypothetical protein